MLPGSDASYLLQFLFLGRPEIPPPYPQVAFDATFDSLACEG